MLSLRLHLRPDKSEFLTSSPGDSSACYSVIIKHCCRAIVSNCNGFFLKKKSHFASRFII